MLGKPALDPASLSPVCILILFWSLVRFPACTFPSTELLMLFVLYRCNRLRSLGYVVIEFFTGILKFPDFHLVTNWLTKYCLGNSQPEFILDTQNMSAGYTLQFKTSRVVFKTSRAVFQTWSWLNEEIHVLESERC